jgi:hypothetical protein
MHAALREAERLEWRLNDPVNEACGPHAGGPSDVTTAPSIPLMSAADTPD